MMHATLLLALTLYAPLGNTEQPPACRQQMTTLTVAGLSYQSIKFAPFGGRVFVYVPAIRLLRGSDVQVFQVWVVEGVYGAPFMQDSGRLGEADFNRLRTSQNVRATPVPVKGDYGSGLFRVGRDAYQLQVLSVSRGGVQLRVCR